MVNKLMNEEKKNNQNTVVIQSENENAVPVNNDKELWRVGVICKKDCFYLTQELLQILEKIGFEWKIISSAYRIKCKRRKENSNEANKYSKTNPLVVEIRIFGDIDPNNNKDEFLVDIQKKSGVVMEFLEFSSRFVSSMQQAGLVLFK